MSHFIIIRGPLGVGKSTIAAKLAEKIKGRVISIDAKLVELGFDKVQGESIPLKNFLKVNEFILEDAKYYLEHNISVIFDGNFYFKEQIKDLIDKFSDYKCNVFTLKASLDSCVSRDARRNNSYGVDAARAVYFLVAKFDYGQIIFAEGNSAEFVVNKILENI